MMPVPAHLRGHVVPLDGVLDEEPLRALVRCKCGEDRFELLYPGQTHLFGGHEIPVVAEIDDSFFFVIEAGCVRCGSRAVLFDKDFHGWDGFVCHDPVQAALPRPALIPWNCLGCQNTAHRGMVTIVTEGENDFIEAVGGSIDPARWPDGFGWFSIDVTCAACGLSTEGLIDHETM